MLESLLLCSSCTHGVGFHSGSGCEALRCNCSHDKHTLIDQAMADERLDHRLMWSAISAYRGRP